MEEQTRYLISIEIDRMTVDLFHFLLREDWSYITQSLEILLFREVESSDQRKGGWMIMWSEKDPINTDQLSTIEWRQQRTNSIRVMWDGVHPLSIQFEKWLKVQFGIPDRNVKKN